MPTPRTVVYKNLRANLAALVAASNALATKATEANTLDHLQEGLVYQAFHDAKDTWLAVYDASCGWRPERTIEVLSVTRAADRPAQAPIQCTWHLDSERWFALVNRR